MRRGARARLVLVTGTLALAGCGSRVPPSQFVNAQGQVGGGTSSVAASQAGGLGAGSTGGGGLSGSTSGTGAVAGGSATGGSAAGGGGSGGSATGGSGGTGDVGSAAGGGSSRSGSSGGGAAPGVGAASCAGFTNGPGITNSTITVANIADISGPIPGLFKSVQAAASAYVAYFNATSNICGRKLKLLNLDSATSDAGTQQADETACQQAFAEVGGLSAFDAGGVSTIKKCGIPVAAAGATSPQRLAATTPADAGSLANQLPKAPFTYLKEHTGGAYKDAAYVYLNQASVIANVNGAKRALGSYGWNFRKSIAIDVTSIPNYNSYATQLKSSGIKYVQFTGAYQYGARLKEAFAQQNYHPVFVMDPVAYEPGYAESGSLVDGTYMFLPNTPLLDEGAKNAELGRYLNALRLTSGGEPDDLGVYAWAAGILFTQTALRLGGKLTRASMLRALNATTNFTANGLLSPQNISARSVSPCGSLAQLSGGQWKRLTPYPWTCSGTLG